MTIDHEFAMRFWKDVFGSARFALDCFGTWMCRDAYSNEAVIMKDHQGGPNNYDYSWNIDHIRPKSNFENENNADSMNNLEPMHRQNNLEKSDNCPQFEVKNKKYCIVRNTNGGYGIVDSRGIRIDWKKDGRYYR